MSAAPGASSNEYSRGPGASSPPGEARREGNSPRISRRSTGRLPGRQEALGGGVGGLILAGALLGSLLLIVAEFTTLYQVHVATFHAPIKSVTGGTNHAYALGLLGLLAAGLAVAFVRQGSRPALLAIGLVGLVALLIALLGDLPDAQASGLAGSATTHYVNARSTASAGLYMETLGAVLLIATCGLGFLMLGPPGAAGAERASGTAEAGGARDHPQPG